jgi:DNA modification methylase
VKYDLNTKDYNIIEGKSEQILKQFPNNSINCVITSPPYWGQREYADSRSIGLEPNPEKYVENLMLVFEEIKRILTEDGSLWLNIGDKYHNKDLMGIPWRVALALKDKGWILRNDVIWNKIRMTQSAKDRLRGLHEYVFHFVKNNKYYYDRKSILLKHHSVPKKRNGKIVSITGTSGVRYREQIKKSLYLSTEEKNLAMKALDVALNNMIVGKTVDFRMTIRGQQRTSHGNSEILSGRAKELRKKGFYVIEQKSEGYMPTDLWSIVPEDTHRKDIHCAVYPVTLLEIPIKATCPNNGLVLDPFMGTGTSIVAALKHGKRGIGIDISKDYVQLAKQRIKKFQKTGLEC